MVFGVDIENVLNDGKIYCYGRDHNFRPILIFNIAKFKLTDVRLFPIEKKDLCGIFYQGDDFLA
jgi:hypothetical protein